MSINKFFADKLNAFPTNPRWSWGAVDPSTARVFLRVWKDEVQTIDSVDHVRVGRLKPRRKTSAGFNERRRHLDLIRQGAEGFGVVCTAKDASTTGIRTIASFDSQYLLRLGKFIEKDGLIYARNDGKVSVHYFQRQSTAPNTLKSDLETILAAQAKNQTTKELLVDARIGQGEFRSRVLELWGAKCSVTGASTLDAIRASHIKPWRASSDVERLDAHNGLPLVASLDALFDAGLISFESSGVLIVSSVLNTAERNIFGLVGQLLSMRPTQKTANYLAYHRQHIFRE